MRKRVTGTEPFGSSHYQQTIIGSNKDRHRYPILLQRSTYGHRASQLEHILCPQRMMLEQLTALAITCGVIATST